MRAAAHCGGGKVTRCSSQESRSVEGRPLLSFVARKESGGEAVRAGAQRRGGDGEGDGAGRGARARGATQSDSQRLAQKEVDAVSCRVGALGVG